MKLSRASIYAILATVQMSESTSSPPLPCSQLAKLGRMPERFLLQVLRNLVTHGILTSTRGVEGGYRLAKPLSQISLLEVIEATDGPLQPEVESISGLTGTSQQRLGDVVAGAVSDIRRRLSGVSLGQLKPAGA